MTRRSIVINSYSSYITLRHLIFKSDCDSLYKKLARPCSAMCESPLGLLFGKLSPIFGELSLIFGELSLIFGELSLIFGELSLIFGEISLIFGELSPIFGELSLIFGELSLIFWQTLGLSHIAELEARQGRAQFLPGEPRSGPIKDI